MSQLKHSGAGFFSAAHPPPAIAAGFVLAVVSLVVAAAVTSRESAIPTPTIQADRTLPSSPVDGQVAQEYGRIDHSFLLNVPDQIDPNPPGASIAAYETPPQ